MIAVDLLYDCCTAWLLYCMIAVLHDCCSVPETCLACLRIAFRENRFTLTLKARMHLPTLPGDVALIAAREDQQVAYRRTDPGENAVHQSYSN